MAKGKNNVNNYFSMNIAKYGEDFLDQKSTSDIQRDAKRRIFKDMAFANIDYEKYGAYFMDHRFVEQLLIVAYDEMNNHRAKYMALLEYDRQHPGDQRVTSLCALECRLTTAFEIIHMYLLSVKGNGYDISCLTCLASQLGQFRNDISNNY